jgi:hypothetical protein
MQFYLDKISVATSLITKNKISVATPLATRNISLATSCNWKNIVATLFAYR